MNKRNRPFEATQPYYTGSEPPNHCSIPIRAKQCVKEGLRNGHFVEKHVYKAIRELVRSDKNLRKYKPKMADILRWLLDQGLEHVIAPKISHSQWPHLTRVITTCEFDLEPLEQVRALAKTLACSPHDVIACAITLAYEKHFAAAVKAK